MYPTFFWVSYEDALLRFGFELIRLKLFHISIASSNLKNGSLGFLPNHSSYGVVSTDLDGALFSVNAKRRKVDNDSPTYLWHCRLVTLVSNA